MLKEGQSIKKVLSVTDQDELREFVRGIFDNFEGPYMYMEASSGEKGIDMALEHSPDIVLMDIGLHSISGIDAARKIKGIVPGCQIIMLTPYLCDSKPIGL